MKQHHGNIGEDFVPNHLLQADQSTWGDSTLQTDPPPICCWTREKRSIRVGRHHVMVAVDQGIFVLVGDIESEEWSFRSSCFVSSTTYNKSQDLPHQKNNIKNRNRVSWSMFFFSLDVFVCFFCFGVFVSKLQFSESNPPVTTTGKPSNLDPGFWVLGIRLALWVAMARASRVTR